MLKSPIPFGHIWSNSSKFDWAWICLVWFWESISFDIFILILTKSSLLNNFDSIWTSLIPFEQAWSIQDPKVYIKTSKIFFVSTKLDARTPTYHTYPWHASKKQRLITHFLIAHIFHLRLSEQIFWKIDLLPWSLDISPFTQIYSLSNSAALVS